MAGNVVTEAGNTVKAKGGTPSPILERILNGGSAVAVNLDVVTQKGSKPIFKTPNLNRVYFFKYPTEMVVSRAGSDAGATSGTLLETPVVGGATQKPANGDGNSKKVLRTGVYVPFVTSEPELGGQAFYIGQHNDIGIMRSIIGVKDSEFTEAADDVKILRRFDSLPSLDPFLLALELRKLNPSLDLSALSITNEEMSQTRRVIFERLRPLVDKATEGIQGSYEKGKSNFLNAIWDPSLPEAALFISAFGIDSQSAPAIFEALRGISFYEYMIIRTRPAITRLAQWLRSDRARPLDWRSSKHRQEMHDLLVQSFQKRLIEEVQQSIDILKSYGEAYKKILEDRDPAPFRATLLNAAGLYWQLGYLSASFSHLATFFEKKIEAREQRLFTFDEKEECMRQMLSVFSRN